MANQAFTPTTIDALKAGRMSDPKTLGLSIEALRTKKVWRYARRVPSTGKIYTADLGKWPAFNLVEAREWAQAINSKIDRGLDPDAEKAREKKAAMTVAEAHAIYIAAAAVGTHRSKQRVLKERTLRDKEAIWRVDIEPVIGSMALADVTSTILWDIVITKGDPDKTKGKGRGVRANRLAAELKVFFKFCCLRNGSAAIALPADPASSLNAGYYTEKKRTRVLNADEIGYLFQSLVGETRQVRRAVLLWLLSACRRDEALSSTRGEFGSDGWLIPEQRSKNSQALLLPLAPWGRSMFNVNTDWIFPSWVKDDAPQLDGWDRIMKRVRAAMAKLAGHSIPHFTPHDLRRTFRSNTRRLGVDKDVAEAIMHHKKTGLEETYDLYELADEKREALAVWERYLVGIATKHGLADALEIPAAAMMITPIVRADDR